MEDLKAPLVRAIDAAGGMASLARKLNERFEARGSDKRIKAPSTIYQWTLNQIPSDYCPDVEALTGVRCEELRPDVSWEVLREQSSQWDGAERRSVKRA